MKKLISSFCGNKYELLDYLAIEQTLELQIPTYMRKGRSRITKEDIESARRILIKNKYQEKV
jgi:hypothetical protein